MGASFWSYVVDYDDDVTRAFHALQEDVFAKMGGARSIEALRDKAGADGTHSILDVVRVVPEVSPPSPDYAQAFAPRPDGSVVVMPDLIEHLRRTIGTVFRMSPAEEAALFGDCKPSRAAVDAMGTLSIKIPRGSGRYTVLFEGGQPSALWFVGLSGD
jgi:hypothetical protein